MDYGCLSCGARYAIPDDRVARAGPEGLRVRCTRCRAIMAVSSSGLPRPATETPAPGRPSPPPRAPVDDPERPVVTGVWRRPFAAVAAPASMSASGQLQSVAGVGRAVTGVFPGLASGVVGPSTVAHAPGRTASKPLKRVWFCAIDGRPRGPYTADELLTLAEKGRLRASTLLWRPGADGWQALRSFTGADVAWLLDAVQKRRQQEQRAEEDLLRRRGIVPVRLERRVVRPVAPRTATNSTIPVGSADVVFETPDEPGALPPLRPWTSVEIDAAPFVWRAPALDLPSRAPPAARRSVGKGVVVGIVVGAVITALLGGLGRLSIP